jgi:ribosomal protein S12 methylthiotransferase
LSALRFHITSLGCAKNTVDTHSMTALLTRAGYQAASQPEQADVLIVNTCGFIQSARNESYAVLKELAAAKRSDQWLIAAGCLPQYVGTEIIDHVSGLDALISTRRWMDIVPVLEELSADPHPKPFVHIPDTPTVGSDEQGVMRTAVQGASAYLKIADGCHRTCAFCAIPQIKGTAVSRLPERILAEAQRLQEQGVRELVLIAQDTTSYGRDLGMRQGLSNLLEDLVQQVPEIDWIRILYGFPSSVNTSLIETMARHDQILPYLDIPLQHAHPDILRCMHRPSDLDATRRRLDEVRRAMPEIALRTAFIVGFPGETDAEFQSLLDFVAEQRFDRLGVFTYSFESRTPAGKLCDPVPETLKQERHALLMALQQQISLEKHQQLIGRRLDVLIEGRGEGLSIGRSYRDAPEIDGLVFVEGTLEIGAILRVQIDSALPYDLKGHPV